MFLNNGLMMHILQIFSKPDYRRTLSLSLSLSPPDYINALILSSLTGSQPFRYAPLCAFGKNQLENRQHEAAEQTFLVSLFLCRLYQPLFIILISCIRF